MTLIIDAINKGEIPKVLELLKDPKLQSNIAAKENYALRLAALHGHLDVVRVLLEYPVVRDNEALRDAAEEYHHLVCYVIAEKCWGNMGNVPQDLKNYRDWPKVIKSIRQGASEHAMRHTGLTI